MPALAHVLALGRKAEEAGLSGVWATDSLGRGSPTLDPLIALAALCGATERIEIGTSAFCKSHCVRRSSWRTEFKPSTSCRGGDCVWVSASDRRVRISRRSARNSSIASSGWKTRST